MDFMALFRPALSTNRIRNRSADDDPAGTPDCGDPRETRTSNAVANGDCGYLTIFATSAPWGTLSASMTRHTAPTGFANGPWSAV
jgi:hypothetical protein